MRQAMICFGLAPKTSKNLQVVCVQLTSIKKAVGSFEDNFVRQNTRNNIVTISVDLWTGSKIELCREKKVRSCSQYSDTV